MLRKVHLMLRWGLVLLFFGIGCLAQAQFSSFPPGAFQSRGPLDAPATPSTTTFNPSDKNAGITLSGGNLVASTSSAGFQRVRAIASASTGKKYWEITITNKTGNPGTGSGNSSETLSNYNDANGYDYLSDGNVYQNGGAVASISTYTTGDVVSGAFDIGSNLIWFRVNGGNWNNNPAADPAAGTNGISTVAVSGPFFPNGMVQNVGEVITANFGATAYAQTVPSGFGNW